MLVVILPEVRMPLPHFLFLIAGVIAAAALTICLAVTARFPLAALGLGAVLAAALVHLLGRPSRKLGQRGR